MASRPPPSVLRIVLSIGGQQRTKTCSAQCLSGAVFRSFASSIVHGERLRILGYHHHQAPSSVGLDSSRQFSTSTNPPTSTTTTISNTSSKSTPSINDNAIILYERDKDRLMRPRAATIVSTFVVSYWSWYLLDFVPSLTSVGLQANSTFGFIGLGTGLFMMVGSILYPRLLVTKLEYVANTRPSPTVRVYAHYAFPIPRISRTSTDFFVGQLSLDPSAHATKSILNELNGKISKYEGHLMVKIVPTANTPSSPERVASPTQWFPFYLLDISSPVEVKSGPTRLLQAILPVEKPAARIVTSPPAGDNKVKPPTFKKRKRF